VLPLAARAQQAAMLAIGLLSGTILHAGSKLAQMSRQPIQCMGHAPHCWAVVEGRAPTPTYNARVICGSTSPASAHNEESDTPRRRTPLRIGNCTASNSSLIDAKVERSEIGAM
jgi:hypothetical protein